ncbi:MAG: ABC transporter substrate-binding protein, partial [Pseudomonadota bacterium]|nr:ABC transporter substrate-binding protein [Pseudomonadota bacterium]
MMQRILFLLVLLVANPAGALTLQESPMLQELVAKVELPPVGERVPTVPAVVDLKAVGREPGRYGGELNTLMGKTKDI